MLKNSAYPMRINKYLAFKGIATRRGADEIIQEKKVTINGRMALLGDKVFAGDKVEVQDFSPKEKLIYWAFHKPVGIITHSPQGNEKSIENIFGPSQKVFPVGRLDKDSSGLIILTNDGRITDKLLNPDYAHEKEYLVQVSRVITDIFLSRMSNSLILNDGYTTKKCLVKKVNALTFAIILTEGKKRQIRRMCERLRRNVVELKRVRILNIVLGDLRPGKAREIKGEELQQFLKTIGLK
jgi:23S rRNA pseudouridine2604 synthase